MPLLESSSWNREVQVLLMNISTFMIMLMHGAVVAATTSRFSPAAAMVPSFYEGQNHVFPPRASPSSVESAALLRGHGDLDLDGHPSPSKSPPLKPSMQESSLSPAPSVDNALSDFNSSSAPSAFGQPPALPHYAWCCEPNMVQRRGARDCNCVYPVRVELFLQNVSLSSNWSDEFLQELASQLHLKISQFEIANFYVVGVSGLNITMDIVPYTGRSFSANQVHSLKSSLALHRVHIGPALIGDYKLINLTWFEPLFPSPAPVSTMAPSALAPSIASLPTLGSNAAGRNKNSSLVIVLSICVGVLVGAGLLVIFKCLHKSNKGGNDKINGAATTTDSVSAECSVPHPASTRFIPYQELKEATNNFEPASMLGEGGFGRVFKGVLSDGMPVAIKKLSSGGHQGDKEFLVEVEMLSRLHHRNLVKLIGYYYNRDLSQSLLCYELVPNGSLESWLHGPLGANCPLDWDTRMKIALDAARGLAYLHEDSQPCVIHRDFKASNILLENDFHAMVSDFGLAKHAPEGRASYLSTRVMGTFGYVAPEYAMTGHLLVKSDVYSYGVVLLELLTGRKPVDMSQPSGQENLVTWARPVLMDMDRLEDLADRRLAGKYPKDDLARVCTIAAACVASAASQRPTMGEVVQSLKMVQRATVESQESVPTPTARPNPRRSPAVYESEECTSLMFSSGPCSGISLLESDTISRTAIFSEDLQEGR